VLAIILLFPRIDYSAVNHAEEYCENRPDEYDVADLIHSGEEIVADAEVHD
jgi:hypothetical protein